MRCFNTKCSTAWAIVSMATAALSVTFTLASAAGDAVCLQPSSLRSEVANPSQPLLDDPGKISFRARPKLDRLSLSGLAEPLTTIDPATEDVVVNVLNAAGTIYEQTLTAGSFTPNANGKTWKYVDHGSSLISSFKITRRINGKTGATEYKLKTKAEAGLDLAHPVLANRPYFRVVFRFSGPLAAEGLQFSVGYAGEGDFAGSRAETLECTSPVAGALVAFNDDDIGTLQVALATRAPVSGPSDVAECVFASNSVAPVAGDFTIQIVDAVSEVVQTPGSKVCGAPMTGGLQPVARDAVYVLNATVDTVSCDLCECDVTSNGLINATDALRVLQVAVGAPSPGLLCSSACVGTPTIYSPGNSIGAVIEASEIELIPTDWYSQEQLGMITTVISIGDDVFYNTAAWESKPYGWFLGDKFIWD